MCVCVCVGVKGSNYAGRVRAAGEWRAGDAQDEVVAGKGQVRQGRLPEEGIA